MPSKSVLFIDSRVSNYQSFIDGLTVPTEVFILDGASDGLAQMAADLRGRSGIDAIHVISHGSVGTLYLGSTVLNGGNLASYQSQLASIGSALTETGDILLYGCSVAQADVGVQFIGNLAMTTGADVAASNNATGAEVLGGDWVLEKVTGQIEGFAFSALNLLNSLGTNSAPTFAPPVGSGKIAVDFGLGDSSRAMAVRPDGKIVLAGYATSKELTIDFALTQFNPDGTLDSSFGNGGRVITHSNAFELFAYCLAVQTDGKLLVGGGAGRASSSFAVARYNIDGSLDKSYGKDGFSLTSFAEGPSLAVSLSLQNDGKVILAGSAGGNFVVARLNADGSLDPTFAGDGTVTLDFGKNETARDATLQADGKVVIAGYSENQVALARLTTNGALDTSFDGDGWVTGGPKGSIYSDGGAIATQIDGKLLVAGKKLTSPSGEFALSRYNPDGSLDSSFGVDGWVISNISPADWATSVVQAADGKIVVAGMTNEDRRYKFAILRYNENGSPDLTFDGDGKVTTAFTTIASGIEGDRAYDIFVRSDGKILVTGETFNGANIDFGIARYNVDGSLDKSFSNSGVNTLDAVVSYLEGYPAVVLDRKVQIYDAELSALNSGKGNFDGSTVTLSRVGGSNSDDVFSGSGTLVLAGGIANLSGVKIGTVKEANGTLAIAFNGDATQDRVNQTLQHLSYSNTSNSAPAQVQIDWTFNDGNLGIQGSGGALSIAGKSSIKISQTDTPYPYWIDALTEPTLVHNVRAFLGAAKTYFFNFPTSVPSYGVTWDASSFSPFSTEEQRVVRDVLANVGALLDIQFVETPNANQLNTITFGHYENYANDAATYPSSAVTGSEITLHVSSTNTWILVHELGHALGLKHPFEGRSLPQQEESSLWTLLSYRFSAFDSKGMAFRDLDIAALQYMYGPSSTGRAGDDTYSISDLSNNFLWDGAGIDKISAEGLLGPVTIHLDPGHWDFVGYKGEGITSPGQITVNYGTLIENLTGGSGNDSLFGNSLSNSIEGLAGNDNINGLAGLDTAVYTARLAAYTPSPTTISGPDGSDTLVNIERFQFSDAFLAFDLDGNAGQVYRLYQAAFNRTPDLSGLGGWIAAMDDGMPLLTIASKFMESAEFQGLYGDNPTNAQFVANLYTNALHRPSGQDASGVAYWMGQLNGNLQSKAQALVNFSESAENKASVLPVISGGITYATAAQAAGPAKGQSFAGTPNTDSLIGTVGNDTFTGGAGNDTIDGGKGLDTAVYSGTKASHTIARTATGLTVAGGSDGTDTLTNVERLKFDDAILAMDTAGNAGQTYRLYQAAFNRTPDKAGLSDWVKGMDTGLTLTQMATAFIGSGEFKDKYGANPTNAQFVDLLYANALHRARAVDDAYWTNQLDSGVTREQALIGFSESAENQASLIGVIQNGIELALG